MKTGVCAAKGFLANGVHCGIRANQSKNDLAVIYSKEPCVAAAVYTTNAVKGAPITVSQKHLADGHAQAIVVNSGNANTCNADGIEVAEQMAAICAGELGLKAEDMVIASTGVIGQPLPIQPILQAMPELCKGLSTDGSQQAALAIMTTDTMPKEYQTTFMVGDKPCTIGGIAKGSGMIAPNMATMLSFVTSDVNISVACLQDALKEVADATYNMVYIDGDTSTNDTFAVLCNGMAGNAEICQKDAAYEAFKTALFDVCMHLSKMLAKDGEGATKLLTVHVQQAASLQDARTVAKSVVGSTLLKCAIFGRDANWGRILCAIGYANANYDIEKVDVELASQAGSVAVCKDGHGIPFDEDKALTILSEDEIVVEINLNDGAYEASAWGCDMTYEYVKINGEYRT